MTPVVLGGLAVLLAGPVPAWLARVPLTRRTPRAAMVLWQAVALAAVLSALGAGLALAGDRALQRDPAVESWVVAAVALGVTGLVVGRLLLSGHRTGRRLRMLRRRHRELVDLVARRDEALGDGARVLDHEVPVAYCVPGLPGGRVVVSAGAVARLGPLELAAVVAHERAHLRARHDLVLEAFRVLHDAFPRWVSSGRALAEVRLLVEVLADAAAARSCGRRALVRALLTLAEGRAVAQPEPDVTLGAAETHLQVRGALIADARPHRLQAVLLLALAGGLLVLPTAFVVAPWVGRLAG